MATQTHSTGAPVAERDRWNAAVANYENALAAEADIGAREGTSDDDHIPAWRAAEEALEALVNLPAPDIAAVALKARLAISRWHADSIGDHAENPATIARILAEGVDKGYLTVRLYQDAARLAGLPSAVLDVEPFSAEATLAEFRALGGDMDIVPNRWTGTALRVTPPAEPTDRSQEIATMADGGWTHLFFAAVCAERQ